MTQQILNYIEKLCNTPSPTGYTKRAEKYLIDEFTKMGYEPYQTHKGNVVVPINEGNSNGLLLSAHIDTLGLMVRSIKSMVEFVLQHLVDFLFLMQNKKMLQS